MAADAFRSIIVPSVRFRPNHIATRGPMAVLDQHAPRCAQHVRRALDCRIDIPGAPVQIHDLFVMDDHDNPRFVHLVQLSDAMPTIPPIPARIGYQFPYARSTRAQVRWRIAMLDVLKKPNYGC